MDSKITGAEHGGVVPSHVAVKVSSGIGLLPRDELAALIIEIKRAAHIVELAAERYLQSVKNS